LPAFHVATAADLDRRALRRFSVVGLTAGTSTLDRTIEEVHRALLEIVPLPSPEAGLVAGGAPRALTAKKAKALLASVRPRDEIGRLRRQLAADLLAELVTLDKKIAAIETEVRTLVRSTPTGLPKIYGVGPVITALTLGEVGDVARFADRNHFASYNGTAPDDKGSAGSPAHCVNIKGNRKLNHAIHMIAITQIRNRKSPGRAYYDRKLAQSKTKKEALRALKRKISDVIYRQLVADAQLAVGPGGQAGTTLTASVTDPTPTAGTSDKPQPGPNPNFTLLASTG
jgi:hypothetical protein